MERGGREGERGGERGGVVEAGREGRVGSGVWKGECGGGGGGGGVETDNKTLRRISSNHLLGKKLIFDTTFCFITNLR